jgi:hypothetical protein
MENELTATLVYATVLAVLSLAVYVSIGGIL